MKKNKKKSYDDSLDKNNLDPDDWEQMTKLGHEMIDDIFSFLKTIKERPVWQSTPENIKRSLYSKMPKKGENIEDIYSEIKTKILPYTKGNLHPRFWPWVQGNGTPFSVLADLLTSGLNPDVCTGEHAAMYIEDQTIEWLKKIMGYSSGSSGVLTSGTSMANLTALLIARDNHTNQSVRKNGLHEYQKQLVLYTSKETHSCISKAADIIGIGRKFVRSIAVNDKYELDINELKKAIDKDRKNKLDPFCVVGNVGTVNTGAIDPINEIYSLCKKEKLWFHIDGAFGAFVNMLPEYKQKVKDMNKADSLSFDLHKWLSLPFGIGCLLVKEKRKHRETFAIQPDYLQVHSRGMMAGPDPIYNYSIEMSRSFRALKVWMLIKEQGTEKITKVIRKNILQCQYLKSLIKKEKRLELMAPVSMNIVCFRYRPLGNTSEEKLSKINKEIVMQLHERGKVITSQAILKNKYVIRIANVNHRSQKEDFDILISEVLDTGKVVESIIS